MFNKGYAMFKEIVWPLGKYGVRRLPYIVDNLLAIIACSVLLWLIPIDLVRLFLIIFGGYLHYNLLAKRFRDIGFKGRLVLFSLLVFFIAYVSVWLFDVPCDFINFLFFINALFYLIALFTRSNAVSSENITSPFWRKCLQH